MGKGIGTLFLRAPVISQHKCRCWYMDWVNKHRFLRSVNQQNQYSIDIHIPPVWIERRKRKERKKKK